MLKVPPVLNFPSRNVNVSMKEDRTHCQKTAVTLFIVIYVHLDVEKNRMMKC